MPGLWDFITGNQPGNKDISTASNFFQSILQGGPQAQTVLAPSIGTITSQADQEKKTNAEFGNRSGGTNAANQQIDTKAKSSIASLIDELTASSASGIGSLGLGRNEQANQSGESLLGAGIDTVGGLATGIANLAENN